MAGYTSNGVLMQETRKQVNRRELVACVREYHRAVRFNEADYMALWAASITKRLAMVGGMVGRW
ncbi:hypothetical protein [Paraburkholderia sp. BR10936]|uniref:hypothetical protein n=1 Tax=Paraburkholderia sp. BR10936 TaxID=3236993 RepID=UPI0034D2C8D7